ncbi:MAG: N-acyl homoserine lactonase family protein [Alphaproteobacteria bacterium]|nr:N-acyl homoserine lactonase family protein [Alphaproteobacteria bacterium]
MAEPTPFEIYAIQYAHYHRRASLNFLGGDPHEGLMPITYYVWAVVGRNKTWIVDTGGDVPGIQRRGRNLTRAPVDGLKAVGVDIGRVEDVIITHMHWDHAGNYDQFPNARYFIQDREMNYATGRHMCQRPFHEAYDVEHVVGLVRKLYAGRVRFVDGDEELAPGLSVHHVGGHTMGMQMVRVWTRRGWVVLASDAAHFYANREQVRPFPTVFHVGDMVQAYGRMLRLADSERHIVPGHDPLVLERYPAVEKLEGVVRLDLDPKA